MYRMSEFRKEDSITASDEDRFSTSEVEEESSIDTTLLDDMDGEAEMQCLTVIEAATQFDSLVVETPVASGDAESSGLGSLPTGVSTESREDAGLEDLGHKLKELLPVKNLLSVDITKLSSSSGPWAYKVQESLKSKKPECPDTVVRVAPSLTPSVVLADFPGGVNDSCPETSKGSKGANGGGIPSLPVYQSQDIRCKPGGRYEGDDGQSGQGSPAVSQPGITPLVMRPLVIGDGSEYGDDSAEDKDEDKVGDGLSDVEEISEDNDDDFKTPTNTPTRESEVKGKPTKTVAQKARRARKNRRQRDKKAEAKAAALVTANLSNNNPPTAKKEGPSSSSQKPPSGGTLKRSACPPVHPTAKRSKLESTPMALEQARYLAVEYPFSAVHTGGQHNPIYRHGPIPIKTLKGIAHSYSAITSGAKKGQSEPSGPPSDPWCDGTGLLLLSLDKTTQSVVGPATATAMERSGVHPPELTFFSSKLLSYGQRIECGSTFTCRLCQSSHMPVPNSQVVFVTASELLGAAGLPFIIGLPKFAEVAIPKVAPVQCWDSLVVLGDLWSYPFKIIQGIYGSFQGDLTLILDLGTQPILQGESAKSVISRIENLARLLVQCLRKPAQGTTRVLVLPPQVYFGSQPLALCKLPSGSLSSLVMAQLSKLKEHIDCRNCERLGGTRESPLHKWGELFSSLHEQLSRDSMGRSIGKVQVRVTAGVVEDSGTLYLRPDYLHSIVSNLVAFVGDHIRLSW